MVASWPCAELLSDARLLPPGPMVATIAGGSGAALFGLCNAVSQAHGRRQWRRGAIRVIDGAGWRERTDDIAAAMATDRARLGEMESRLAEVFDIIEDAFEVAGVADADRPVPHLALIRNPSHSQQAGA